MFSVLACVLACGGESGSSPGIPYPDLCDDGRCASDLASNGLETANLRGDALAQVGSTLLIGNAWPIRFESSEPDATVVVASLPDLREVARWTGPQTLGDPIDVAGDTVAVGAVGTSTGTVFLLDGVPVIDGAIEDLAVASVSGERTHGSFGHSFALASLSGEGLELAVAESGYDYGTDRSNPGAVYLFPLPLAGRLAPGDATRQLVSDTWLRAVATWDADGDGIDDLVIDEAGSIARFASPWTTDLVSADAATRWTTSSSNGSVLKDVGDLDGDGLAELAFAEHTWPEPDRYGAVWLLRGGDLAGSDLADVAERIEGDVPKMALGTDVEATDFDGDGVPELVVGAASLDSSKPGQVLLFDPPLGGVRTASDAVSMVHGLGLGWEIATADAQIAACDDGLYDYEATCWLLPGSAFGF